MCCIPTSSSCRLNVNMRWREGRIGHSIGGDAGHVHQRDALSIGAVRSEFIIYQCDIPYISATQRTNSGQRPYKGERHKQSLRTSRIGINSGIIRYKCIRLRTMSYNVERKTSLVPDIWNAFSNIYTFSS